MGINSQTRRSYLKNSGAIVSTSLLMGLTENPEPEDLFPENAEVLKKSISPHRYVYPGPEPADYYSTTLSSVVATPGSFNPDDPGKLVHRIWVSNVGLSVKYDGWTDEPSEKAPLEGAEFIASVPTNDSGFLHNNYFEDYPPITVSPEPNSPLLDYNAMDKAIAQQFEIAIGEYNEYYEDVYDTLKLLSHLRDALSVPDQEKKDKVEEISYSYDWGGLFEAGPTEVSNWATFYWEVPTSEDASLTIENVVGGHWGGGRTHFSLHWNADKGAFCVESGDSGCQVGVSDLTSKRSNDLNLDGFHEDINGNFRTDHNDVVTFFHDMYSDRVKENPDIYDFNENGRIDFDDIVTLFEEI